MCDVRNVVLPICQSITMLTARYSLTLNTVAGLQMRQSNIYGSYFNLFTQKPYVLLLTMLQEGNHFLTMIISPIQYQQSNACAVKYLN